AGRRPAVVVARLEGHVEGRPTRALAGGVEGSDLGVFHAGAFVMAHRDDLVSDGDYGADGRVGRWLPPARLFERAIHQPRVEVFGLGLSRHAERESSVRFTLFDQLTDLGGKVADVVEGAIHAGKANVGDLVELTEAR